MKIKTVILLVLFFFDLMGNPVSDILKEIPIEDRQNLEYLFTNIFLQQDGAYTIFGDKPVASAAGFLIPKWEAILKGPSGKLSTFMNSIHYNGMLFGILLGFGAHNFFLYGKSICTRCILKNKIKLESFCKESYPFLLVNKVQFKADLKHSETRHIQNKYKEFHEKISALYSQENVLDITLKELMTPD